VHNTTYAALRDVSPMLAYRTGLDTAEDSMEVVAAKVAELVNLETAQVSEVVQTYNQLMLLINRQFVYWDQELTRLEKRKATKT